MKFKEMKPQEKKRFIEIYKNKELSWDERMESLMNLTGKGERTVRRWASEKMKLSEKEEPLSEEYKKAKEKKHDKTKKRFIITSAQNATDVNSNFLENIEAYAKYIDAEILVIPYRYKNPTSIFTENQEKEDWWDKSVIKYLTLNRHDLNNGISVLSDIKIQPTSSKPLQGLEGMTGEHSSIVGHPRLELKTIPVMEGCRPKILFTTGSITNPNFTDTKAGKMGEFHFSFGFSIVEIKDNETFFFRQVSATDSGEFIDLYHHVKDGVVKIEKEVEACAMGDIHVAHVNPEVIDVTVNSLFKKLKPKKLFIHDIMDSESISHHNLKNPFIQHELEMSGRNSLSNEVDEMIEWLKKIKDYNTYIVKSNHDIHIDQFLSQTDWRKMSTFKNALPYMEYATATLKGEAPNGVVPYLINKNYPKFKCLTDDCNVTVKGYLMSVHGHLGASGSRGSINQYSRLSTKSVTGHSHTIARVGGAVSVGTSTHLRVGYNKSFSAWLNAHGIVNRLGKFQHIVFFKTEDGIEYTTFK